MKPTEYTYNLWSRNFWDCLQTRDGERFPLLLSFWLIWLIVFIVCLTYAQYCQFMLGIHFRTWMTQRFQARWLNRAAFFRLGLLYGADHLDNPDQRLEADVKLFTTWVVHLIRSVPNYKLLETTRPNK